MESFKIKDIPLEDRPYERCLRIGADGLSDTELLSIIIRTGSKGENSLVLAQKILALNYPKEGILGLLHLTLPELMQIKGIGKVKGTQLLCIGELSKRIWKRVAVQKLTAFLEPRSIVNFYIEEMRHMEQEHTKVMLLNSKNMLIKDFLLSKGTVNATLITPRELYIEALRYQAVHIILIHNHPSGDPAPSKEDVTLTRRIKEAGDLLGIQLLDHIIIGDNDYISFKERGIL